MVAEKQYKISEMTKMVHVEAHVLRYWEEELQLPIKRNNLGHRYYTQEDVERFLQIKELKDRGLQLKGIRSMLDIPSEKSKEMHLEDTFDRKPYTQSVVMKLPAGDYGTASLTLETDKEEKAYRLQMLLKGLVKEAVQECNTEMAEDIKESIIKEMDYQFRVVTEEQEKQQVRYQKQQEEYFEKLDYMIQENFRSKKKRTGGILNLGGKGKKKEEPVK